MTNGVIQQKIPKEEIEKIASEVVQKAVPTTEIKQACEGIECVKKNLSELSIKYNELLDKYEKNKVEVVDGQAKMDLSFQRKMDEQKVEIGKIFKGLEVVVDSMADLTKNLLVECPGCEKKTLLYGDAVCPLCKKEVDWI